MHALFIGAIVGAVVAILTGQKEPDNVSNIQSTDDKPRVKPGRKAERKSVEKPLDDQPVEEPLDEEPLDEEPLDEEPLDEEPLDEEPGEEQEEVKS